VGLGIEFEESDTTKMVFSVMGGDAIIIAVVERSEEKSVE
jgi:hypothetical protein